MTTKQVKYQTHYGADQVRNHPNIYLGSSGLSGCSHTVIEILANSNDEAADGYGDTIELSYTTEGTISVRDYGRGVPLDWNPDYLNAEGERAGAWMWDILFNTMYSSGKYEDSSVNEELLAISDWSKFDPSDYTYLFSVGTHGVGAKVTQFTSSFFEVTSFTGAEALTMRFEKGKPVYTELQRVPSSEPKGTLITWKPDDEVFTDTKIPVGFFRDLCKSFSFLSGITYVFTPPTGEVETYQGTTIEEYFRKSLGSDNFLSNHTLHHEVETLRGKPTALIADITVLVAPYFGQDRYFNNSVKLSGGVHADAVNTALSKFFARYIQGIKVIPEDYISSFTLWVSTLCNQVDYRGQTKDSLENEYVYRGVFNNVTEVLDSAYAHQEPWLLKVLKSVETRAKERLSRKASQAEVRDIKRILKDTSRPSNFVSCSLYGKPRSADQVELFIPEGESATTSLILSRDASTQCMLPQKGKELNVYKSPAKRALENEYIRSLTQVLGTGIYTGDSSTFDIRKLKVGKIILASDADVDGWHIRNLNFLIFWKFFPELLFGGYIYIAETPRYSITYSDGTMEYFRDDTSFHAAMSEPKLPIKGTQRYKGLGEVNPEVLSTTTVNPATRNLVQIKVSPDDAYLPQALEILFGQDTEPRKGFIIDMTNPDGYEGFVESYKELQRKEKIAIDSLGDELQGIETITL